MIVTIKLSEIADIRSGFVFRGEKRLDESGEYLPIIQVRDVSEDNRVQWERLSEAVVHITRADYSVREGDILVRSKGHPHTAVLVDQPIKEAVVASQFFILRLKSHIVMPEYLAWYINRKPSQDYLNQYSVGTNIRQINKPSLSGLKVHIPPLKEQKIIVTLVELQKKESNILALIREKRQVMVNTILLNAINQD